MDIRDILKTLQADGESATMEEAREILSDVDADKDGVINFEDFKKAIQRPSFDALAV